MENITLTDKDIRLLVTFAQGSPEFLPFYRACFRTADLVGKKPEEVIAIARTPNKEWSPEIAEAMRVPQYATMRINKGIDIIF